MHIPSLLTHGLRDQISMIERPPINVIPLPGETAQSVLLRLAIKSGSSMIEKYLTTIPDFEQLDLRNHQAVSFLAAHLTGSCYSEIERSTPLFPRANVLFMRTIGKGYPSWSHYCPRCIREDIERADGDPFCPRYIRGHWHYRTLRYCLLHAVRTEHFCKNCERRLRPLCIVRGHCSCGQPLALRSDRRVDWREYKWTRDCFRGPINKHWLYRWLRPEPPEHSPLQQGPQLELDVSEGYGGSFLQLRTAQSSV